MAAIPLVGQSYTARSLTVAAQTCINVFPELIQDPNERAKNKAALYGCPGRHVFKDLTAIDAAAHPVRGVWSGGGRLFVAAGTKYFELSSAGALIGSVRTISNASVNGLADSPVQFFPNGNQLFIVAGGLAYIDNGGGPTQITFSAFAGTVQTRTALAGVSGYALWISGDKFDPGMAGAITIGGTGYVVAGYVSATELIITGDPGASVFTGVVDRFAVVVQWVSGDKFDSAIAGGPITINSIDYVVASVASNILLYLESAAGNELAKTYTAPKALAYTCAAPTIGAVTGGFLDNAFIINRPSSRVFNISGVNNGNSWNGTDFGSKDSWPDHIRSILVDAEQLYLFGDDSFEVHQGAPGTFPFRRIDGAGGRWGSASPWGPIAIEGTVYFIAQSSDGGIVACAMDGFTPHRISTHGEESQWNALGLGANCISYSYREEGHTFWCINFGLQTWVFEVSGSGAWHRRNAATAGVFATYPTAYHTFVAEWGTNGKHITGGPLNGTLYESSVNFYDDAGIDLTWERAIPYLFNDGKRMYGGRMTLEMETGTVASGAEPVVYRDYSDDQGHTWSTPEAAGIGVHADGTRRVYWATSGSWIGRVFRFKGSGQSKVALVSLDLEMELGTC